MTSADLMCNEDGRVIEFRYKKKKLHEPHKPGHPKFIFRIL